ncbi:hypothetical protein F1737_03365 [Methanoplanus sp. FWC-SCC4]|uniref:Uncharacterized protein n=1 Tax=Methanochimaera problematica TaxID=2609417 RepID=A0AA97FCP4_9EURY|nr:hypothetical protein [Methanoplanus sp. FWC-SCC4]WOF15798.1 hypothetical protein F1737_03365 [Methanoplanus sp. FWC-SCC4]
MRKMMKLMVVLTVLMFFASPAVMGAQTDNSKDNKNVPAGDKPVKTEKPVTQAGKMNESPGLSPDSQMQKFQNDSLKTPKEVETQNRPQNTSGKQVEVKERIRLKQQEILMEHANLSVKEQSKLKNQNQIRVAVHTLLMAEDIDGGIGSQISAIAKEYNNSVKNTYSAEERIQNRDALSYFFFGGDKDASGEILRNIEQNQQRIENLNQLISECDCDDELRLMLQEQITALEKEQNRLRLMAQDELNNKGLLGGLFG